MLSDALHSFGRDLDEETLKVLAHGTLTPRHATAFCGYVKIVRSRFGIEAIIKGRPAGRTAWRTATCSTTSPSPSAAA